MVCLVCGDSRSTGLTDWHAACRACGYESAALQVTINQTSAGEPVDENGRERGLKAIRQENFRDIVSAVLRFAQPGSRRLLDVGCAHGWFLETARDHFDVLGIEPDAIVGGRTAARGLPVRAGYFPDALQDGETFDVIVFNDVIEHIPDIRAALAACDARLSDNGVLVLNLPSSTGFFYRLSKLFAKAGWRGPFDRLWQKGLPSPHVHYFNPDNLQRLLEHQGFERIYNGELPSLRAKGLLDRIRCAGNIAGPVLYVQYAAVLCTLPLLAAFPSDIIVSMFRKTTRP